MSKKIVLSLMFFLIAVSVSISQDKQDWKFVHPSPQSNLLRRIKMVNETNWVTAGGNGSFMHTSNSGANWYFHHFAGKVSSTLATTQCFDLWFFDSNTGIVVGDQGYIGRTTNGGVSFDSVGIGLVATNSRCWRIWFADGNTGYIGAGSQNAFTSRILKTTDAGITWTTVYSSAAHYIISLGGFDAMNVMAVQADGNLIRTTNGGTNWTETPGGLPAFTNDISFINSTTGMTCGGAGIASRTTNGGLNWESVNTPQTDWSLFQIKTVSETEVYAIGDPGNIYKTTNLGTTWTTLPISVSGPSTTFVWYSLDKFGSTYVLSGDYGIVAKSTDGCATWSSNSFQLTTALMFDITTVPGTSKYWTIGRAYTSTTREVLYSSNSGTDWTSFDLGYTGDFFSIVMLNENIGYVSGQNSQVMKTTDGGATWTMKTKPHLTNYSLYNCEFVDENTGWVFVNFATVPGGNVFKTTNGGDNWTQYSTGATSENIYHAEMLNANTGFCVMNQSNRPVYKTTNGGVNWTGYSSGLTGSIRSVSVVDSNIVYVCQTSGASRIAKSTNGGVNWTTLPTPAVDFTSMDFINANTGYASGNLTTAICKTTNGGLNWTLQNAHTITLVKVFATQGDTAWVLGGNASILRNTVGSNPLKVNLTYLMEGMYSSGTNQMSRRDTVEVYLRNASSPFALKDSATAIVDTLNFSALYTFTNSSTGTYYIVPRHLNSIETWSKAGGESLAADGSTYNYDFTTSSSQAFGNNMVLKGTEWCTYSGDINQDGAVDVTDLIGVFNDGSNFVTGYVATDVNGDNFVDITDLIISYNNSVNFVGKITP